MPRSRSRPSRSGGRPRIAAWLLAVCAAMLAGAPPAPAFTFDVPKPSGFVVDQAGVLDPATERRLVDLNRELQAKTGAEIAVVVVRTTEPEPIFDYAMAVAESWKPGSAEKDNGVVFLVATEDREMYILTGYGAEGPLPDGLVGEIRDRLVVPAFKRGDYAKGILDATSAMATRLAQDAGATLSGVPPVEIPERRRSRGGGLGGLIFLVVVFLIARSLFGGRGGRSRRRGRNADLLSGFVLGNVLGGGFPRGRHGGFGGGGFGGSFGGGGGFGGFGGGGFGGGGAGGSW